MSIVCLSCEETLWIGQRDTVYTGEEKTMDDLAKFLVKHRTYDPREVNPKEYHELLYIPEPYNGGFEHIEWKYWREDNG